MESTNGNKMAVSSPRQGLDCLLPAQHGVRNGTILYGVVGAVTRPEPTCRMGWDKS